MKLVSDDILKQLPGLGKTDKQKDPIARVKLFDPYSNWTWFILEASKLEEGNASIIEGREYYDDVICYGLVIGFEKEFGNFSLKELELIKTKGGHARIERDLYFEPKPISKILEEYS